MSGGHNVIRDDAIASVFGKENASEIYQNASWIADFLGITIMQFASNSRPLTSSEEANAEESLQAPGSNLRPMSEEELEKISGGAKDPNWKPGSGGSKPAACDAERLAMKAEPIVERPWEETKSLVKQYIHEVQECTGRKIPKVQRNMLKEALREKEYVRLSSEEISSLRREYRSIRNKLISDWEINTGQKWPTYTEEVFSKGGNLIKHVGDPYDAHHIIELSNGGENAWWNIFPAKYPDQHQGGIHAAGSASRELFRGGKK